MIPAPEAIISLIHGLAVDPEASITSHFKVLQAVAVRIGPSGFCWAPAATLAAAATVSPKTLEHSLARWSGPAIEGDPSTGVLQRVDARSQVGLISRRHSLYYCPRLTRIEAPGKTARIVLCDDHSVDCEPEITHVDGRRMLLAPDLGAPVESREVVPDASAVDEPPE